MNSSSRESPKQTRNLNETSNITTILPPEITSTPFISNKSKVPSPLVTPTRKFLGPRRYALSNNGMLNPVKTIKDPPGPLLASTAYNVNVSTYIDTKSPGYAGRLVQYNEESSRKQQNTHQEKYGSPGLFPIVHLFKKEVPVLTPKLKKGTVRIGTPESRGYYSQEHNRLLLEGIVRNNSILKEQNTSNEASTRSVLDALKEISRKRIHVSEDYEPIEDNNKKLRRANGDGDYSKRNRVESPPSEHTSGSPTTQAKKRLCTIDAVLASKTSSMYANYETSSKRKSVDDSNRILPMNKKKFNNVETQTPGTPVIVRELKRSTLTKESEEKKVEQPAEKGEEIEEITSSPKQVLKVLDDKPLEVIRKNRLGALLSALSGREIPSIPMEDRRKALDQDWPSHGSEKTLVSILSPQNKQSKSLEKHVTFELPSNTSSQQSVSERNSTATEKQEKKNDSDVGNKNSSALSSVNNTVEGEKKITDFMKSDEKASSLLSFNKSETSDAKKEEKEKTVGGFKFDLNKPFDSKSSVTDVSQKDKTTEDKTKQETTKTLNFSSPSSATSSFKPMLGSQSFKPEGLSTKFENSFGKGSSTNSLGLPTSLPASSTITSSTTASAPFMFGSKPSSEAVSVPSSTSGNGLFAFGKKESSQSGLDSSTSGKTGSINSSPFGASKTVASPSFSFSGPSNVSATNSDNHSTSSSLTTSTPSFGFTATSVSTVSSTSASTGIFPSKTLDTVVNSASKSSFGTSNSSPGGFKFASGNSLPAFGGQSINAVPATSTVTSNTFGSPMNSGGSSANAPFETSTKTGNPFLSAPANVFGTNPPANNAPKEDPKPFAFGASNNQNSGTSNTSAFPLGTNQSAVTTSSSTSAPSNLTFGSTVNSTSNMFAAGKNSAPFGASTAASSFGTTNTFAFGAPSTTSLTTPSSTTSLFSTNNTVSFGTTNAPFGSTNTPSFGTTSTPSFGTTNTSSFGTTSTSSFGTTNTPSFGTTSTPSFGTTNTPSFGTSSAPSFGAKTTASFGTTSTPSFGTTNPPSFGTTNAPSFGTAYTPNFGSTNTPNYGTNSTGAFGTTNTPSFSTSNTNFSSTSTPTYGTISTPSFGTTNSSNFTTNKTPLFGNNSFGTTNPPGTTSGTNNAFGAKNTSASVFGTNTPAFGTPTTSAFGTTNTSTFGNPSTASTFGGSFSSPSTLSAPSFGNPASPFGNAATSNANAFNSNSASSNFGSANSFGTFNSNNSQFPSVTTASGFGTSTNNTFGNSPATNAFGANPTSSTFGSTEPASPFGTNINPTSSNAFGSSFGKKPEQSSGVFPSSTNNMFNSNSTFGSAQSNNNGASGRSSSSGIFTFGSSNSNAPSSAGVFTFGAPETPKSFNFNAAGNAGSPAPSAGGFNSVPSFGQPSAAVPNMFSIGSGNSTSTSQARGRPLVRARRRT